MMIAKVEGECLHHGPERCFHRPSRVLREFRATPGKFLLQNDYAQVSAFTIDELDIVDLEGATNDR